MQSAGAAIIGDEILSGKVRDENSTKLIEMLARRGVRLERIIVLGDDVGEIGATVSALAARYDHVFTSGGVGCFGFNSSGQLGNGSTTGSRTPVPISSL